MDVHVLPTLPEPNPSSHGHEMPPAMPGRYDEPLDLGTGQAAFFIACIVLALTFIMGVVAISHLTDRDSLALHSQRAVAAQMDNMGGRFIPVSAAAGMR